MTGDRPLLGIALMLAFCLLAPLADGLAKAIGDAVPLAQVVAVRFAAQAVLLAPFVLIAGGTLLVPRALLGLVVLRAGLHVAGVALMFLSLRWLPLADAIAIAYVMPFFVLLLGAATLGEEVGARRLLACIAGFAGTLLIMRPSFVDVGWIAALPVAVAAIFAVFMTLTRTIARAMGPVELQAVNGLVGAAVLCPLVWLADGTGWAELDPVAPDARLTWLLLAIGVLGTLAHLALTWSLRWAPAATLAPMQYLEIPFAVLVGWAMFRELPDGVAVVGIAVVAAAGIYVVLSERRRSSAARPAGPPAPPAGPPAA